MCRRDERESDSVVCTGDESKEKHDVWAVKVLPDGTMVSGDGGGSLQFWDAVHGVSLSSFKQHKADILCVAASPDGRQVFASGADNQIAVFQRIDSPEGSLPYTSMTPPSTKV